MKIENAGIVQGLPSLGKKSFGVYGPCQFGKQLKSVHKVDQQITTLRVLELLHMDLMGPMQVKSVTEKWYIFVCVDDFSKDAWVYFIREKSETFYSCVQNLKLKKIAILEKLLEFRVTMVKNLKTLFMLNFVTNMVFLMSFLLLRH